MDDLISFDCRVISLLSEIRDELVKMNKGVENNVKIVEQKSKEGENLLKNIMGMLPEELKKNMGV